MSDPTRSQALIDRYLEGQLQGAELAELETLLQTDPETAERFVQATRLQAQLDLHFGRQKAFRASWLVFTQVAEAPASRPQRSARRWRVAGMVSAAAALAALVLLTLFYRPGDVSTAQVLSGDVRMAGAEVAVSESGPAVLRLADGSLAELEPSSRAVLRGRDPQHRQLVQLEAGGGTFRVTPGDGRFTVVTDYGQVTALGTEFTVRLGPSSGEFPMNVRSAMLMVAVLSGLVQVEVGGDSFLLSGGENRAFGEERPGPKTKEVRGKIVEFDSTLFKLKTSGDNPMEKTFNLMNATKVLIDNKPAKLFDLQAGQQVQVEVTEDGTALLAIRAQGPSVFGTIEAVDETKRTITLTGKGDESGRRQSSEYAVADDAKIEIDEQPVKLSDLKPRVAVVLQLGVDGKTVIAASQRVKREEEGKKPDFQTARGVVSKVDEAKRTLSLTRQGEGGEKTVTVTVAPDAKITVDGEETALADLPLGREAFAKTRGDTPVAFEVTIGSKKEGEGRK